MNKIAIIGAGISGLSIAQLLKGRYEVVVFEAESRPGGMIKCDIVEGNLFHRTGGHVFNTKRQDVLDWFWGNFDRETEFHKATRNASVSMPDGKAVPYPIENYVYYLDEETQKSFIEDLISMAKNSDKEMQNFEEFLLNRFGRTLYELYFKPYNQKVWRKDLSKVPLSWLEGKLPMPTLQEIIYNNMNHIQEQNFVHSSFYYAKQGGSQFIADRLANGLTVKYNSPVEKIQKNENQYLINGEVFDKIVFCGNIKSLPAILAGQVDITAFDNSIEGLEYHGTTSVFCEIEKNPYSWVYMPSTAHESHRVICTGNFAISNNIAEKLTGTIEFTDEISKDDIIANLARIPFAPKYLTHNYEKYTYPIQNKDTKEKINALKQTLEANNIYLCGRFAEWEYYNMDVAVGAAIDLNKRI